MDVLKLEGNGCENSDTANCRPQANVSDTEGAASRPRPRISVHRLHGPDPVRRQAISLRVPQLAVDGRRRGGSTTFDRAGRMDHLITFVEYYD